MGSNRLFVLAALALVLGGGLLARLVQTGAGKISVTDVRFQGAAKQTLSGLLYVPEGASEQKPAPAVLAIHGYINSREMQSPYAIELSRRGYVVLAIDQSGHGYSDPPAFANGYGGPAGLAYLRSLKFVDRDQVVLEGHSMGGWASLVAAGAARDDYRSIIVSGSSTGVFGAPEGDATFPRNFGLVFGRYDEFSDLMWGAAVPEQIVLTDKLKKLFGTSHAVEPERLYGSIAQGTARKLWMPAQIHPANHITHAGVAPVLSWIQDTTRAPAPRSPDDQIWQWKELGTALALLGAVLFVFAFGRLLLASGPFATLAEAPLPAHGATGIGYRVALALSALIPMFTYFPLMAPSATMTASALLPQNLTTGLMLWAEGTGVVSLLLFVGWHFASARKRGADAATYGLKWPEAGSGKKILLSLMFAFVLVGSSYALVLISDLLFKTDFRLWVVAAKPLSALQLRISLVYLPPFAIYFIILGLVLHGQLRSHARPDRLVPAMLRNAALTGSGFVLLLVLQYAPLLAGGTLGVPEAHLFTILALQLVVVLPVVGLISTYFFYKTGHLYVGATINALLVTWLLVGGQATHFAFAG
jgi:pimeloyl-ACP methyl ester carboxylesterase